MIRIYLENIEDTITLQTQHMHYLKNVMRCKNGQEISVFDNQNEWSAEIQFPNIILRKQIKNKSTTTIPKIGISYIRKHRLEWAVEKATELGVEEIYLLICERVNHKNIDLKRLQRIVIEAAEQCGRIGVPTIYENINLNNLPAHNWVIAEKTDTNEIQFWQGDGILIGPEGGWSDQDLLLLNQYKKVQLHNNILRAETAVCTALSLYKSSL